MHSCIMTHLVARKNHRTTIEQPSPNSVEAVAKGGWHLNLHNAMAVLPSFDLQHTDLPLDGRAT